jgi:hypothetical protein
MEKSPGVKFEFGAPKMGKSPKSIWVRDDIAILRTETYERFMRFKNGCDVSRWSTFWTTLDHNHDRKSGKSLTLDASFTRNLFRQHRSTHDPPHMCELVNITLKSEHPNILFTCLQSLTYPQYSRKAASRSQFIQRPGGAFDCVE